MPAFSQKSKDKLLTCDQRLQDICSELIKEIDFTILCGHRGESDQNLAFSLGKSRAKFGQSKHNSLPSMAVDIAPYPVDWDDLDRFRDLAEKFCKIAVEKNINIKWGGDFTKLVDMPHFEIA